MKKIGLFLVIIVGLESIAAELLAQQVKQIPSFNFMDLEGKSFTEEHVQQAAGMFLYFNPQCDVCKNEMKMIQQNASYFQNKQLILVSPGSMEDIRWFLNDFDVYRNGSLKVLHDSKDKFYKLFHAKGYPSLFVFNKNKELTQEFEGQTSIQEIMSAFDAQEKIVDSAPQNPEVVPGN